MTLISMRIINDVKGVLMQQPIMGRADLHIHTDASDGKATVKELLSFVTTQRPHLNTIAITDHDTLDASLWAYERKDLYPFDIIPGLEVSTCEGHILALWVTEPIKANMDLADTVIAIHELGGLAILAHPVHPFMPCHFKQEFRSLIKPQGLLDIGIDALEVHNAGIAGLGFNWLARQLARTIGVAITGGSDAHTLGAISTGETWYKGSNAQDLYTALKNKTTLAKGTLWSITDYVGYFKHEHKRKAMMFSDVTNSSTIANL